MKAFAALLSVWILFLSLLPCTDVEDHTHFPTPTMPTVTHLQEANHSSHGDEQEHCAPFCHCNCCQSTVTLHQMPEFIAVEPHFTQSFPQVQDQMEGRHQPSLWHPPLA